MKLYNKIARFLSLMLLLGLIVSQVPLMAQQKKNSPISGVVKGENGEPVIGATILLKGTTIGTSAGATGSFELNVPKNGILIISSIGYEPQEIAIAGKTRFEVTMKEDINMLDAVVAVGYGTLSKKDITGSVASLSGKDLVKAMDANITESLSGRVGGVLITKSSNRPGAGMNIEIRGKSSLSGSNNPLYVVDGVPSYNGIGHLNAADIESLEVLKDASSTAVYGSRGANGVVIVTTKGASKREGFSVDYNGYVGVKTPTNIPDMIGNMGNGMEYYNYRTLLWKRKYGEGSLSRNDFLTDKEKMRIRNGEFYDWIRELSSNSMITEHNISGSGGTEKTSYTLGLGYLLNDGFIGKESHKRYTVNVGLEHRISKKFTLGIRNYIALSKTNHGSNDALLNAYLIPPIVSPYDDNGNYLFNCQPTSSKINPFIQVKNDIMETEAFYANVVGYLEYKPIEGLSIKTQAALQYNSDLYGAWNGTMTQQNSGVNPPSAWRNENRAQTMLWDNIISYNKTISENHRINATAVFSMQQDVNKGSSINVDNIPYESLWHAIGTAEDVKDISSYYYETKMMSAVLRLNYSFKDRYVITLTGRYDGTSRLAKGNRWGFMPSAAIAWQIKNENFLKDVEWISSLRPRLSYGKSGKEGHLRHDITWLRLEQSRYSFGDKGENGFGFGGSRADKDLRWEMSSELNFGLDFGFFNNRLSGTLEVYSKETKDLILNRKVSSLNGYSDYTQNIGRVSNKGVEVAINSVNISKPHFTWRTDLSFSLNRNAIKDLWGDKKDDVANRWFIGQPIGVYYDLKQLGIWQEEEAEEAAKYGASPGHIKIWDKDKNYSIDENDFTILGSRNPDYILGMTNTFTYRNFDLSVFIYSKIGGLYNDEFQYMFTAWDNEHWNKLDVPYWTPENRNNKYPAVAAQSYNTQVLGQVKGSFLKIKQITLGYTLPDAVAKKLRMSQARAYVSVQNPFTFSSYLGSDPEIIGENVYSQMSLYPMTFSLGLNVKF